MTTAICSRCNETIESIQKLKEKIKTCDKKKCKCKTHKFQNYCADIFECSNEDFISAIEINLTFHPVKLPTSYYPRPTNYPVQGPVQRGGGWLCINDPMKNCTCGHMAGMCNYFPKYGYY